MAVFPACLALADANVSLDANVSSWGHCLTQSVGMGDPNFMGAIVLLGFAVILLMGRQNLGVASMLMFGLSSVYYIISPSPFWLTITIGIAVVSMVMLIKGVQRHAK